MKRIFAFTMLCLLFLQFGMTGAAYAASTPDNTNALSVDAGNNDDSEEDAAELLGNQQ